jgi:acyl-CoA synthetase (AMP-forming)/AMP-acid ligase II
MTMNFSALLRHHTARAPEREVLAAPGTRLSWGELDRRVDARFKVPKDVRFLDQLPRNPSGKVLKRVLRDRLDTEAPA